MQTISRNYFSISASSSVTYAYLGEFNTNKNRSTVIAFACIFAGAAYVYLPCKFSVLMKYHMTNPSNFYQLQSWAS